jgi:asparagine synthetase B (glutamine-hydrolysing)
MLTPDGRYALVFNGEVYNFRQLRDELERVGVPFAQRRHRVVCKRSLGSAASTG